MSSPLSSVNHAALGTTTRPISARPTNNPVADFARRRLATYQITTTTSARPLSRMSTESSLYPSLSGAPRSVTPVHLDRPALVGTFDPTAIPGSLSRSFQEVNTPSPSAPSPIAIDEQLSAYSGGTNDEAAMIGDRKLANIVKFEEPRRAVLEAFNRHGVKAKTEIEGLSRSATRVKLNEHLMKKKTDLAQRDAMSSSFSAGIAAFERSRLATTVSNPQMPSRRDSFSMEAPFTPEAHSQQPVTVSISSHRPIASLSSQASTSRNMAPLLGRPDNSWMDERLVWNSQPAPMGSRTIMEPEYNEADLDDGSNEPVPSKGTGPGASVPLDLPGVDDVSPSISPRNSREMELAAATMSTSTAAHRVREMTEANGQLITRLRPNTSRQEQSRRESMTTASQSMTRTFIERTHVALDRLEEEEVAVRQQRSVPTPRRALSPELKRIRLAKQIEEQTKTLLRSLKALHPTIQVELSLKTDGDFNAFVAKGRLAESEKNLRTLIRNDRFKDDVDTLANVTSQIIVLRDLHRQR